MKEKKTKTIVISAEMFWYLDLAVRNGKSIVRFSAARKVGSKNFLNVLVQFLVRSKDAAQRMKTCDRKVWECALAMPPSAGPPITNSDAQSDENRKSEHPSGGNDLQSGGGGKNQNLLNQYPTGSGKENQLSYFPAVSADCFGYDTHGMKIMV